MGFNSAISSIPKDQRYPNADLSQAQANTHSIHEAFNGSAAVLRTSICQISGSHRCCAFMSYMCSATVYSIYVSRLCMASMYRIYVSHICMTSRYRNHVSRLWCASMYRINVSHIAHVKHNYVSHLCGTSLDRIYVPHLCIPYMLHIYVQHLYHFYVSFQCRPSMYRR